LFLEPKVGQLGQNGAQTGAKNVKKTIKQSIKMGMSFWIAVFIDFGPELMPKWRQIGINVEAKTDLNTKRPQSLK